MSDLLGEFKNLLATGAGEVLDDLFKRLGPPSDDTKRLAATVEAVREMYEVPDDDGTREIGTALAGRLLISLGAERHVACDPAEEDKDDDADRNPTWKDADGDTWILAIKNHGPAIIDRFGRRWHWAGGFEFCPDKQPLLSRDDWSEDDIPMSLVRAAAGPLRQEL